MLCRHVTLQEYRDLIAADPGATGFETEEECNYCDTCPLSNCLCSGPNYGAINVNILKKSYGPDANAFPDDAANGITRRELYQATLEVTSPGDMWPYYSTEDPCYFRCAEGVRPPDQDPWSCRSAQDNLATKGWDWRACYPGLLDGKTLYGYRRYREYYYMNLNIRDASSGVWYNSGTETKYNFYVCDGDGLVDVSDIIMEKYPVKYCETYYDGPQGNLVQTSQEFVMADVFHQASFYNNKGELRDGVVWISNFFKYGQTNYDWQSEVGLFDMSSGLPSPNMIGCS
jgi:hypothetical protein